MAAETDQSPTSREWSLAPEQELRVEIEPGTKNRGCIKLKSGNAEIFGTELAQGIEYIFSGRKFAVFTWHGCVIETSGSIAVEYIGSETPMQSYLNVHLALDQIREAAKLASVGAAAGGGGDDAANTSANIPQIDGPRVLIVGQADSGKTSLAKILANYAAKRMRKPVFVDIDPSQGSISIPGTLGSLAMSRPLDCEEEFGASLTLMGTSPLVYYYGFTSPSEKPQMYSSIVKKLALVVNKKLQDPQLRTSGIIVDTPSRFAEAGGFDLLLEAIMAFRATVVLVIGHERLYSDLMRQFGERSGVSILKLSKSGGTVTRDKEVRRKMLLHRVKEYFYGTPKNELTPFSQTMPFSDIAVRRAGDATLAPASALPLGMERKTHDTRFVKVEPGDILLHSILAVSQALLPGATDTITHTPIKPYTPDEEAQVLIESCVAGFIYISEVEDVKRKMTVLCPSPGRLPKTFLVMGALKWMDV